MVGESLVDAGIVFLGSDGDGENFLFRQRGKCFEGYGNPADLNLD